MLSDAGALTVFRVWVIAKKPLVPWRMANSAMGQVLVSCVLVPWVLALLFLLEGTSHLNHLALACKVSAASSQLSEFVCDFDVSNPTASVLHTISVHDFPLLPRISMAYACFLDLVSRRLARCEKTFATRLSCRIVALTSSRDFITLNPSDRDSRGLQLFRY